MPPHAANTRSELKRAAPFLAAALVAFATVALPPSPNWTEVGAAAGLFIVICGAIAAFPAARPPRAGGALVTYAYFLVVVLLRDAQGGAIAGYAPLMMLPVFWLALHGTRPQLYGAVVGVAASCFLPLLLIGGDAYGAGEWRRGILFTVTSAVVGVTAQSLVARLRESDEGRRSLIAHLPDTVMMVFDRDMRCLVAEGPMLERAIFEGRRFQGMSLLEGVPEERHAQLTDAFDRAFSGESSSFEYGSPLSGLTYETEMGPYRLGGAIVGVMSVSRDITARRRAEAEVQAARERFAASFESAPIGMALVALDGAVTAANPALADLLGYTAEQLRGMKADDVLENRDPAVLAARFAKVSELVTTDLARYTADERYRRADGQIVDVAVSISLVRDVDGTPSHCIAQILDITERKQFEGQLRHLAERDPLTGLLNRREFAGALDRYVDVAARGGLPGAAILLDVDHFKTINDTHGHQVGDQVLEGVGRVIERSVRIGDVVARLGGDEFAILLPNADADAAERVAQRLVQDARDSVELPAVNGSTRALVTLSVGVALVGATVAMTADEVLEEADRAMYRAKRAGRNGYAVSAERGSLTAVS